MEGVNKEVAQPFLSLLSNMGGLLHDILNREEK
jgi:hypothetical protein